MPCPPAPPSWSRRSPAPDEVRLVGTDLGDVRAREAVSTPIDRLHALEG
ncbi:hypothetical protein [Actinomyces oris]|nr:hypothetical protein [Actinomyces oris]